MNRTLNVDSGITSYSPPNMYSSMYWPFRSGSTGSDDPPSSELLRRAPC